jgi:prepilin-type N-terminal cleavage/methylation domain-containing protein
MRKQGRKAVFTIIELPAVRRAGRAAFTLIELLVVIAIIAMLVSILLPSLSHAKKLARIATAHAELRGITVAMAMYRDASGQHMPPTRFSCSSRTAYELPTELLGYLPRGRREEVDVVRMPDPFTPEQSYRYRAVGPAILNETTILEDASTLWVPDAFPDADSDAGRYHSDPKTSPVRYAVWSMGPDPDSAKFDLPGRLPVPERYWLTSSSGAGVIAHMEDANGLIHTSP